MGTNFSDLNQLFAQLTEQSKSSKCRKCGAPFEPICSYCGRGTENAPEPHLISCNWSPDADIYTVKVGPVTKK